MNSSKPKQTTLLPDGVADLYESILKSLPLTTLLCDRKKRIIDLINPTSLSPKDYPIEQYIGSSITELLQLPGFPLHNILLKFDRAYDEMMQTGKNIKFEYEFKDEYYSVESALLGTEYIVFHIRNITAALKERMDSRNELIKQNELIMNNANCGFIYITPDYKVAWENTTKVLPPEFADGTYFYEVGEPCYKNEHRMKNSHTRLFVEKAFKEKTVQRVEKLIQSQIWIEMTATPVIAPDGTTVEGVVLRIEDITERIELRKKSESLNNQMKTIVNTLPVGVEIYSSDGQLVFLNDIEYEIFGVDKETFDLSKVNIQNNPNLSDRLKKDVAEGRETHDLFSYNFETVNGSRFYNTTHTGTIYLEYKGKPVIGASGKMENYVFIVRDVTHEKEVNDELQKKKQLQENILNSIPVSIHIKDMTNDFRYVFCNDESKRLFGTDKKKTTYDVMDADKVARIEKTDKEVFATGKPYFGLEHIELKDGRVYDTLVRKSLIYDGHKPLLLNVRWDQSLQNDLERRAKVLDISMEAMNAYSWFYEPDKDKISFGEGSDKIGQDSSHYDTLSKFIELVHPDEKRLFRDSIYSLLNHETDLWNVEYRADLNEDGIYEWWHTRGMMETTLRNEIPYAYLFGMTVNIDRHKQAELMLLKHREELNRLVMQNEMILNNTNSGLAYITTDYKVQWENISICSASLSPGAYQKGELCYRSTHGRNTPCENCVMTRALQSRQMEQAKFTLDNGNTAEIFATPVFREDMSMAGAVIRVDDVTERERMIGELKDAKAQAEQSDKLKSAFLANMSHEIRTPLNAIIGFSGLLADTASEEEKEEYLQIINVNNELLLKLINDILDLSKIEAGTVDLKYEDFDLSRYFDDMAASMNQRVTNPNVRLITDNPYPYCKVRLDKNRTAQIMTNYVTNAIKYTPKGFIEVGYKTVDEGVLLYVKDSGIGIPDEKKNKVFHRFEKLDEFAQGTGLGLSICKAIAESMGGRVGFDSKYGEGSCFWAILPCTAKLNNDLL